MPAEVQTHYKSTYKQWEEDAFFFKKKFYRQNRNALKFSTTQI